MALCANYRARRLRSHDPAACAPTADDAELDAKRKERVAYVQQQVNSLRMSLAITWQYVSRDGGRHRACSATLSEYSR